MRNRVLLVWILFLLVLPGCGRKLPPLPPTEPDPVEIGSIRFEEGRVVARIRCNVADATVTLLGKPKGICPHCTDDLTVRDTGVVEKPGMRSLRTMPRRLNPWSIASRSSIGAHDG